MCFLSVCKGGKWICGDKKCPKTCSVLGMGHFRTFDGKFYDFKGSCEYTLVEQINKKTNTALYVSYKKDFLKDDSTELIVRSMNTLVSIKDSIIHANSILVSSFPFVNADLTIKKASQFFYSIEGVGFKILFDGLRIYISLDQIFVENTRGLCGTFNYNSKDDFLIPNGFIELDVESFVGSYKLDGSCRTPKQTSPCQVFIAVSFFLFTLINY